MKSRSLKVKYLAAATALAMLQLHSAYAADVPVTPDQGNAQTPPAEDKSKANGLNLDSVVVTGTAIRVTKMKASVSISTLDADQIKMSSPTNAAEVLRSIPGIRSESSGGEGNANLTVRGLPISAGGARYVQFQENGLPILQFGDIAFATPDMFMRIDGSLDHLEVLRGGSASTLATNSPGGIINFISKTGEEKGGSIGLSTGLNFNETRYDFDYGSPLGEKTRAFVAGFYRVGDGLRNGGVNGEDGGQIRGNITHDLDDGFIRLSFKHLDDKTPMNLPVAVTTKNGTISELPGIDPRKASFYSPYWIKDITLDKNNNFLANNVNDGLHAKSNSLGLEGSFKIGDGWTLQENFRKSANSGRFIGVFPGNNGTEGSYTYATGPNAGKPYLGKALSAVVFDTSIDDAGNTINDMKLSKNFKLEGGAKLTATGGLYMSLQKVDLTWSFNEYLLEATGDKPALLINSSKSSKTSTGYVGPGFGNCCTRAIDVDYKTTAPYANLSLEIGPWNIDGGLRHDRQEASGTYNPGAADHYDPAKQKFVDYQVNHNSYSVGANYRVNKDVSLFARISDGIAFNADRILFGTPVDGTAPININTVKQYEGGVKWRQGGLSTFLTLFKADTEESNYEATTQKTTANTYHAKGIELEAAYRLGEFRVNGGLTYTNANIAASNNAATVGKTPRRQADVVYQITPSYSFGEAATLGASLIGTTKSWGDDQNTITLPAYQVVNLFANYQISAKATVSLSVNNLFNKIGYTEVEDDGHAARSIDGRSAKLSLKYMF